MKVQWCWRCKTNVPMLDEGEFAKIEALLNQAWSTPGIPREARFLPVLTEYERLTGMHETNPLAVLHHRISIFGPPCPTCGKVLRTPQAYKCFECGHVVHKPNWSYVFAVRDVVAIKGRGVVIVGDAKSFAERLSVGDAIEVRHGNRIVVQSSVEDVEAFHGPPAEVQLVGIRLSPDVPADAITAGDDVWLVSYRCQD